MKMHAVANVAQRARYVTWKKMNEKTQAYTANIGVT